MIEKLKKSENEFRHESLEDAETVKKYLDAINDGLGSGHISLGSHDEEIILTPKGLINLKIKAKKKKGESEVSLKLSWKELNFEEDESHSEKKTDNKQGKKEKKEDKKKIKK